MKLISFFLFVVCMQVKAEGFSQKITIQGNNLTLKTIFNKIEKRSGYSFFYSESDIKKARNIDVNVRNKETTDVIRQVFKNQPFEYKIVGKTVVIKYANEKDEPDVVEITPIDKIITGKVINQDGTPLDGVSVTVVGSNIGVTTDHAGNYSLSVPSDTNVKELEFSMVGYLSQRKNAESSVINVTLVRQDGGLDEVVITGYGIKEHIANQIGSAYTVTAQDLEKKPVERIDRLLEGIVPGYEITSQDQSNSSIRPRYGARIRGEASAPNGISSNEPLWIVDGVPLYTGGTTNLMPGVQVSVSPLSYLNPNDIESIVVMKDASATTIYGANGANGVVYITTKKGASQNRVNLEYRAGLNQITNKKFHVLNGPEYNGILQEMGLQQYIYDVDTDWSDVYFRNGLSHTFSGSFSGSSNGFRHFVSGSIFTEDKTVIANNTNRYTGRINLEKDFGKRLSLSFNSGGAFVTNDMFNPGSYYYTNRPTVSPYNPDGTYALRDNEGKRIMNSLAEAYQNDYNQSTFSFVGNVSATLKIVKGLSITSRNGIDYSFSLENEYNSMKNLSGASSNGYARRAQSQVRKWISSNTINFEKKIADGELSALLGMEANETKRASSEASGSGFAHDGIREVSYASDASRRGSASSSDNSSLSYLGRISYVWKRKYAINGSFRKDGDSNFGSDVKWATFNSIGAAWTISNEDFWGVDAINFLKTKISYGTNGNSRFNGNYSKGIYSFSTDNSYGGLSGATMIRGVNDKLKWETTRMFNTGLDIRFLNRVKLSIEYYYNHTVDMISNSIVSFTSGQRRIYQNQGELENKGVEIVLESDIINNRDFTWHTSINFSRNRSKVLKLAEGKDVVGTNTIMREGYNSRSFYLIRWAGVDPRDGKPLWYDADGNITRVYDPNNRVVVGNPSPDFYGGINNNVSYKDFSVYFQIVYSYGGYAFSTLRRNSESDGLNILSENQSKNILDHWKQPGDLALTPALSTITTSSSMNSTRFLLDRTNIRLQNISLSYSLNKKWIQKFRLRSASVYLQGDNIAFWTPYKNRKDRNGYETSFETWPIVKTYSLGINVSF